MTPSLNVTAMLTGLLECLSPGPEIKSAHIEVPRLRRVSTAEQSNDADSGNGLDLSLL